MQSFDKMTCVHRKFGASSADVTISGWDSSMAQHLGEIKEITDFRAGRCELEGEWWMLGLLEACETIARSRVESVGVLVLIRGNQIEEGSSTIRSILTFPHFPGSHSLAA